MTSENETSELFVDNGDIRLRVEVTGTGPTILCVHGWPELAHSWRHQVAYFAANGYRVAAMDVRGSGGSSSPAEVAGYTLRELSSDVAAVIDALGDGPVVLLGHDWGSPIVLHTTLRYPDRVRAVAALSVPHSAPADFSLLDVLDMMYADRFFYMLHFQEPGIAEAEFDADMRAGLKRVYFALSGAAPAGSWVPDMPRGTPFLPQLPTPPDGPLGFLPDADLDLCAAAFVRTGLTGALNRYRALGLDPQTSTDIVGALVSQPSCFIGGSLDPVRAMIPGVDFYADTGSGSTDFRGATIVEGAGHWVQQEAPDAVNAALDTFLNGL